MEDALARTSEGIFVALGLVLILVVMEDALAQSAHQESRFNNDLS